MKKEDLFRAIGEVREDQIEAAETVKKQIRPWRRFGALAACLAVLVTAVAAAPWIEEQQQWKAIVKSFQPSDVVNEKPPSHPIGADSGGGADLDGTSYGTSGDARPAANYSANVEIGELAGPGDGQYMIGASYCMAWFSPEEILAQDTAVFRGTVRELQYFIVETDGPMEAYYTKALVEVTDPIRGNLAAGETTSLLWLGAKGYMTTSLSGALDDLDIGSDAIFMPVQTTPKTGNREGGSYFCYADLADFYLSEGNRYVFAATEDGLAFDRNVYEEIADAETLDEVAEYIREQLGMDVSPQGKVVIGRKADHPQDPEIVWLEDGETSQPAANPVAPQTEASPSIRAENPPDGPSGAREESSGAVSGGKSTGGSP